MNILFIGAHTDDIELGAGGTLSRFLKNNSHKIQCLTFSKCLNLERNADIRFDQDMVLAFFEKRGVVYTMLDYENTKLEIHSGEIRKNLEGVRDSFEPDLIFTHWNQDTNQDHQTIARETFKVFRKHSIFMYDIPNSCFGFSGNCFIALSKEDAENKIMLTEMYATQKKLGYFNKDILMSHLSIGNSYTKNKYSESFICYKFIIEIDNEHIN